MAVSNNPVEMQGNFKNVYDKAKLHTAIPQWCVIQDRFKFESRQATGNFYAQGVVLQRENGATYSPSSGAASVSPTLNASVAGFVGQAQIEGYGIFLRARIDYLVAAKAAQAGEQAFAQATAAVLKNLKESHQYRLECSLLYGRDGLGIVSSNTSGALVITAATWATGIWATGLKGAILESFTGTGDSVTQHNGDLTIASVSVTLKTVTVTGTSAAVVANDVLYFKGARTTTGFNECPGLFRILSNTGTLFNISAASYELWQASSYAVSGNLSLTAIMQAAAVGMSFGLQKAILLCSPTKFGQLASDEAALRRFVQDTPNAKRGVKGITFMLGQVEVEIVAHPLVRDGHAMLLAEDSIHRIGSTDVTMALPGSSEKLTVHVTDQAVFEFRSMSDQGIYSDSPAQCVLMTGIT